MIVMFCFWLLRVIYTTVMFAQSSHDIDYCLDRANWLGSTFKMLYSWVVILMCKYHNFCFLLVGLSSSEGHETREMRNAILHQLELPM